MFVYAGPPGETAGFAVASNAQLCLLPGEVSAGLATEVLAVCDAADPRGRDAEQTAARLRQRLGSTPFALIVRTGAGPAGSERVRLFGEVDLLPGSQPALVALPGGSGAPPAGPLLPLERGIVCASAAGALGAEAFAPAASRPLPTALVRSVSVPVEPEPAAEPPAAPAESRWWLRLPDGRELRVDERVEFGRLPRRARPAPARSERSASAVRVRVGSPRREISGRHLELSRVGGRIVARDLASKNGTVVSSGARQIHLAERSELVLLAGDVLDLGDSFAVALIDRGAPEPSPAPGVSADG